ncbi:reverse transcriptase domain-containing protein [Oribacterium sp. FC2011]|uniref:reverse transcriptase domain-containing protein n=1 Tax=Oribacterium sp. FC2011 TaxID=1408311 RepID=UPI001FA72E2C|nr:reverse transcriptase domain-containing protein [Oribacterium sp. FC2011]
MEIPKDNGKTRPLSIYCYEDKLVQEALRRILEAVFEPMFYDEMMDFRPNRSCHLTRYWLVIIITTGLRITHGVLNRLATR